MTELRSDGGLTVVWQREPDETDVKPAPVALLAGYVAEHVTLRCASTVHAGRHTTRAVTALLAR